MIRGGTHKGTLQVESGIGKGYRFYGQAACGNEIEFERGYKEPFPQQLPGPAHPEASPGADPQHAVSPGPGIPFLAEPEREEGAESILFRFRLPQEVH
jgi:hypothetical protein